MQYVTPYEQRYTVVSIVKQLPSGDVKEIVGHRKNMDTFGIYEHEMDGDRARVSKEVSEFFKSVLFSYKETPAIHGLQGFLMVEVTGFEPATPSSRTKYSTKLSHTSTTFNSIA